MEKEVTGLYMSGHPLQPYAVLYDQLRAARIDRILSSAEESGGEYTDGDAVTLLGMVAQIRTKTTKSNTMMAYVTLEDLYGSIEVLVFPRTLSQFAPLLQPGSVVLLNGRISVREEEDPKLLCDRIFPAPEPGKAIASSATDKPPTDRSVSSPAVPSGKHGLYVRVPSVESAEFKRMCLVLNVFIGTEPLYIRFTDTGKLVRAPQNMCVWPHDVLLRELRLILGEKNVAILT